MYWVRLDWNGTPQMDTLGSPYGSDNPTASGVLGSVKLSNYVMMYSVNVSSLMLRYDKGVMFEADPQLL